MTKEEYDNKMKEFKLELFKKIRKLNVCFSHKNNPYNIGDIIEDHYHIIKIETIIVYGGLSKYPTCKYSGIRLKKDLSPFKSGEKALMYQSNVKILHK
jgi:hypothetical protein